MQPAAIARNVRIGEGKRLETGRRWERGENRADDAGMTAIGSAHPPLRLAGDTRDPGALLAGGVVETLPVPSLTDLLREARRAVLVTYGPCCSASEGMVAAWARRLAETRPMPLRARLRLLEDLAWTFGSPHADDGDPLVLRVR